MMYILPTHTFVDYDPSAPPLSHVEQVVLHYIQDCHNKQQRTIISVSERRLIALTGLTRTRMTTIIAALVARHSITVPVPTIK